MGNILKAFSTKSRCQHETTSNSNLVNENPSVYSTVNEVLDEARTCMLEMHDSLNFFSLATRLTELQVGPHLEETMTRENAVPAFLEWCSRNGIEFAEGVEIATYPYAGLGLTATKALSNNDLVIKVPYGAMLNSKMGVEEFYSLLDRSPCILARLDISMALKLVSEKLKGAESFWQPYLDVIPRKIPHPIFFSHEELAHLEGSPNHDKAQALCRDVILQYCHLYIEIYQAWFRGELYQNLTPTNFTLELFRVSAALAASRSFMADSCGIVLAPYWDLCNNGKNENLHTQLDFESICHNEKFLYAYAGVNIQRGEQLTICYLSSATPATYFTTWGIVDIKYYDSIRIGVFTRDKNYSIKMQKLWLRSLHLKIYPETIPLEAADVQTLLIVNATTEDLEKGTISEMTWNRAWRFLSKRITQHLQRYRSRKVPVDGARKPGPTDNIQFQLAHRVVEAEIAVLQKALTASRTLLKFAPTTLDYKSLYEIQPGTCDVSQGGKTCEDNRSDVGAFPSEAPLKNERGNAEESLVKVQHKLMQGNGYIDENEDFVEQARLSSVAVSA